MADYRTARRPKQDRQGRFSSSKHDPVSAFWLKVDKSGPVFRGDLGPCWDWMGAEEKTTGYGAAWNGLKVIRAHVYSFQLHHGRLPLPGYEVCHHCDNRLCVRPDHLFEGTRADNMKDAQLKGRTGQKLTPQDVLDIVELYKAGNSIQSLAKRYEVAGASIHSILAGQSWKHVTGIPTKPKKVKSVSRKTK